MHRRQDHSFSIFVLGVDSIARDRQARVTIPRDSWFELPATLHFILSISNFSVSFAETRANGAPNTRVPSSARNMLAAEPTLWIIHRNGRFVARALYEQSNGPEISVACAISKVRFHPGVHHCETSFIVANHAWCVAKSKPRYKRY